MNRSGWTGVVLAGGRSSRMGRDKALVEWEGRSLLDRALDKLDPHVREVLVIGEPEKYGHVGPFVIADEWPGKGPLGGLATAMRYASNDRLLVIACDLPGLNDRLFEMLKGQLGKATEAVVPRHDGLIEPLAAAYHRNAQPAFRRCVELDVLKMSDALGQVRTSYLEVVPGSDGWPADLFRNINRPGDL
ncbi:MAG: molybdenum cofactor guanylyltransferase [Flavobacteriales bacterium]|nr:molybdenum cofactor guanylyltransferase [Flavobacteriales bacterium]